MNAVTLDELLNSAGVTKWDLALLGDGSGQGWDKPAGWACVSIDRQLGTRNAFIGGVSAGTVNFAEAECYLHALRFDLYQTNRGRLQAQRKVCIFSDSEVTVRTGNGEYRPTSNPDIWWTYEFFRQQGYLIHFYWVERNSNPLHINMDAASKQGHLLSNGLEWILEDLHAVMPYRGTSEPIYGPQVLVPTGQATQT